MCKLYEIRKIFVGDGKTAEYDFRNRIFIQNFDNEELCFKYMNEHYKELGAWCYYEMEIVEK